MKKKNKSEELLLKMVEINGLEPSTPTLERTKMSWR